MPMDSAWDNAALPALGFPIRASADHRLFSASPRLIAAVHALLRLLVPRHPPCALPILTVIRPQSGPVIPVRARSRADADVGIAVRFSRSVERRRPDWPPVSQNSTACRRPRGDAMTRLGRRARSRHGLEPPRYADAGRAGRSSPGAP